MLHPDRADLTSALGHELRAHLRAASPAERWEGLGTLADASNGAAPASMPARAELERVLLELVREAHGLDGFATAILACNPMELRRLAALLAFALERGESGLRARYADRAAMAATFWNEVGPTSALSLRACLLRAGYPAGRIDAAREYAVLPMRSRWWALRGGGEAVARKSTAALLCSLGHDWLAAVPADVRGPLRRAWRLTAVSALSENAAADAAALLACAPRAEHALSEALRRRLAHLPAEAGVLVRALATIALDAPATDAERAA